MMEDAGHYLGQMRATQPLVPQPVFFNGHKPHALTLAPRLGADNAAFGLQKQELSHEL